MDHFKHIYRKKAQAYQRLVAAEDVDGNLFPAIERVAPVNGAKLLDLGSGTGRIPLLANGKAAEIITLDLHASMLHEQQEQCNNVGARWKIIQGDMRELPIGKNWADITTAGWAIGHFMSWYGDQAKSQINRVIEGIERVTKSGGGVVIIESLTTGSLTPAPPSDHLAEYYTWLEDEWGFTRQEIQTDYQFNSLEEAAASVEFFFGTEFADKVRANNWVRLPEWTGVWGKTI